MSTDSLGLVKYSCRLGQDKQGVEQTPEIVCSALQSYCAKNHRVVHAYNSNEIVKQDSKEPEDEKAIFRANLALRQLVLQSLKSNRKTVNIGGDHTMGMGTVSAFLECYSDQEKIVLWIDAHADVNTRAASKSGHYHGMPVAFLLGLDTDPSFPIKVLLQSDQLVYVGLRDVDPFEKNQVIDKYAVRCLSISQVQSKDLDELVTSTIGKNKYVHISWDVDSTNPATEITSTGTTAEGGLTCEQVKALIRTIAKYNQLVSLDVTELNLKLGSSEQQQRSLDKTLDVLRCYLDE